MVGSPFVKLMISLHHCLYLYRAVNPGIPKTQQLVGAKVNVVVPKNQNSPVSKNVETQGGGPYKTLTR
jgi:hypothetical protein